jgi:hypothetical protein
MNSEGTQPDLVDALRRLGAGTRRREAPARVERRLRAEFRGRAEFGAMHRPVAPWFAIGAWAAALLVTTGLALFVTRGHQPDRTERTPHRVTQIAALETAAAADLFEQDFADGFIPLPNSEALSPTEPVNLVRLELPRSAVLAWGISVTPEGARDLVEADVMLGADGVARAVRFLE